jgi:hypothetical protein
VIYQHPLAYLLGLEGVALLRAFSGEHDRDFTHARFREIRALLDSAEEFGEGVAARSMTTREGYALWAPTYDEPGNRPLELEQPIVRDILDGLPLGLALDAACGTGRHSTYLASLGYKVIGVDTSPAKPRNDHLALPTFKLKSPPMAPGGGRNVPSVPSSSW